MERILQRTFGRKWYNHGTTARPYKNAARNLIFNLIEQEKIKGSLIRIIRGKAQGDDKITANMLKALLEASLQKIRNIMNLALKAEIPRDWQMGIITPIYKIGSTKECL